MRAGVSTEAATATSGGETQDAGPTTYLAADPVVAGMRIDRYLVIRRIGAGGMGVVFAAYDPELDRRVAIKLVRDSAHRAAMRRERLLREARAMARLDHANVVRVFDAGSTPVGGVDQVFVAMELIDGTSLGAWAAERPQREVLGALVAAGRGLAAAHRAGIVHRDFKPENVLVDRQDRVRVGDFGLARERDADEPGAGPGNDAPEPPPAPGMTVPGTVMGTPAFMAPEQHRGDAVDARADQFAFCVAAWLLVYGRHPFGSGDDAVLAGRVGPAGSGPSWLEPLLRKGLADDPADRHATLDELLDAIDRRLRPRRTWIAIAGGAAVLALGGAWVLARPGARDAATCPEGAALIAGAWGPAQRQALAARGAGGASTAAALDRFAEGWARAHDDSCAARNKGDLAPIVLERRDRCLELARAQLASLAPRLSAADDAGLVRGAAVVASLTSPASCLQPRTVVDEPLPEDQGLRAIVQAQRAELGVANAFAQGGQHAEASAALARLTAVAYPPLAAEIAEVRADLADMRGDDKAAVLALYDEAIVKATASGHDTVAIGVLLDRAHMLRDNAEAVRWFALAEAMIARLGDPPNLRAHLHGNRASLHIMAGDHAAAVADARRAYELRREDYGADADITAAAANNLANALAKAGKLAEARDLARVALVDAERAAAPDGEIIRRLLDTLVQLHLELNDRAAARVTLDRLHASLVRVYGAAHFEVAKVQVDRGKLLGAEGKHADAVVALDAAVAALAQTRPDTIELAAARGLLANQLDLAGRPAEAEAETLRSVATFEKALGEGNSNLARVYTGTGFILYRRRKLDDAELWLRKAIAIEAKAPAPSPRAANTHGSLALVLAARRRWPEARRQAERALELAGEGMTDIRAEAELALARALRGQGDPTAATAAAKRALAHCTAMGDAGAELRAEVDAFLAEK